MLENVREDAKKRIIKFVNQTQVGCEKQACLSNLCKCNPGKPG